MPITSASEAAQRLDEYLQRAVANCEDTPPINLRHSSNPGASLFSHISQAANRALDVKKDSGGIRTSESGLANRNLDVKKDLGSIRPSEIRKAGGKVTAAGGLIKVDKDARPSSPKRVKLDEAVLTKIKALEKVKVKPLGNDVSKMETETKHEKTTSGSVSVTSIRDNSTIKNSVANLIKLEHVRQATHNRAGNTIVLSGKTGNDSERFNIFIRAREPGKSEENSQRSENEDKQSSSSENGLSSSLRSGLISLKSLAELEKRLSPQKMIFRVSEKVETNSIKNCEARPRPLIPGSQLPPRGDQTASKDDPRNWRQQRFNRSNALVPASQLESRVNQNSSEARPTSQNQSNQALRQASRGGHLPREVGQVPQSHLVRSSHVLVTDSPRGSLIDTDTETDTELYNHASSELDEDYISSSSHLPYENIFNPSSPHSRPNIGLSEMFDDGGFDSLSNFLNNDNVSTGSNSPASINGSGSPIKNSLKTMINQGRILSGHGSTSAFSLVKDSAKSAQSLESPNSRTGSVFNSRSGNSHKPLLTRLRQSATHTVTSSSASNEKLNSSTISNKFEKTATISKPSDTENESEEMEKDFIKKIKPGVSCVRQKKVQPPKPGELRRAGPYLLGESCSCYFLHIQTLFSCYMY